MSELFDPVFGASAVTAVTDDRAWLRTLCAVEAALARACARVGLIEPSAAAAVETAVAELAATDPAGLGRQSVAGGNPVIPLATMLRERVGPEHAAAVHLGATSQDILDTALVLICRQAVAVIGSDLIGCADAAAELAARHRSTPMVARTLLQQAQPTTFGALTAGWGAGLDRASARLAAVVAELPAQLGGAAGTLAAWHPHGLDVAATFAADLDLPAPDGVWHTERTRIGELGSALGVAAVALGKVATDIVLLAQTEVGELREGVPGGSSSMPHKENPIAAITARAAAAQAPGLVATLLASGAHELQRGAGPWHAEWPALTRLLRAVGGSAARLRGSLGDLQVDPRAMARNLAMLGTADPVIGHAPDLVDRYLGRRPQ
jgi:3-carboxy-cis,cis-muconate cycloisomerase